MYTLFVQASSEIYDVALKKVQSFVAGRILETKIAGKIAASLCRCLVKIRYTFYQQTHCLSMLY